MQVKKLDIEMAGKYSDHPGTFHGTVTLEGLHGKQEVTLTSAAIAKIFSVIREDVVQVSKLQAKQTDKAMEEAEQGPLLIAQSKLTDDQPF